MTALRLARAQLDAVAVLAAALIVPGAEFIARRTRTPSLEEEVVAGIETTVVRPASRPPWPALVFVNGATSEGRRHPLVQRLGWGLGWAGYVSFIPELPGVAAGELTPKTRDAAVEVTAAAAGSPETRGGRIALAGVSTGATLCLLAAADPELAARVSVVAAIAPFTDLEKVIMLATTGVYRTDEGLEPYSPPPYLLVALARSLAANLPRCPAGDDLCAELRTLDEKSPDPLAPFRRWSAAELGPGGVALHALLANRDPARFAELYAELPNEVRAAVDVLSPARVASHLVARTEILSQPRDKYFPLEEALAVVRDAQQARLTLTSVLSHGTPALTPRKLFELGALDGFTVRALAAARSPGGTNKGRARALARLH